MTFAVPDLRYYELKMPRAPRNRTMTLSDEERTDLRRSLLTMAESASIADIRNRVIHQDIFEAVDYLPSNSVDLLFVDPPYNLTKSFGDRSFKQVSSDEYVDWMDSWLSKMIRLLKPTASIYICGDWRSSAAISQVCERYFTIRNRITFEREKGRGAKRNWKNNHEDIWFATVSDDYYFDAEAVKLRRRVMAPYKESGEPKDWEKGGDGNFRLTSASNIWTDLTIPFWSMTENTPHPTQKPEKLLAKIILASSKPGDVVLDPFAGAGTTGVVAKKLDRQFVLVEIDEDYCLYAQKRINLAEACRSIQGYTEGVFWERNSLRDSKMRRKQVTA